MKQLYYGNGLGRDGYKILACSEGIPPDVKEVMEDCAIRADSAREYGLVMLDNVAVFYANSIVGPRVALGEKRATIFSHQYYISGEEYGMFLDNMANVLRATEFVTGYRDSYDVEEKPISNGGADESGRQSKMGKTAEWALSEGYNIIIYANWMSNDRAREMMAQIAEEISPEQRAKAGFIYTENARDARIRRASVVFCGRDSIVALRDRFVERTVRYDADSGKTWYSYDVSIQMEEKNKKTKKQSLIDFLPSKKTKSENTTDNGVFLLGLSGSGKTVYMTTVIARLKEVLPKEYGCTFSACSADVEASYEKYYRELYQWHMLPEVTPINQAQLSYKVESMYTREVTGITFSDMSDELSVFSLAEFIATQEFTTAVTRANLILVTLDVMEMEKDIERRFKADEMFNFVIPRVIGKGNGKKDLAIVLTKSDELTGEFGSQSLIYRPVKYDKAGFDMQRAEINNMLREYMYQKYPEIVMQADQIFGTEHVNYFAVSALGNAPVGGRCEKIEPKRVEEPVLWLMDKSGVMA